MFLHQNIGIFWKNIKSKGKAALGTFLGFIDFSSIFEQSKFHENEATQYFCNQKNYDAHQAHFGRFSLRLNNLKRFDSLIAAAQNWIEFINLDRRIYRRFQQFLESCLTVGLMKSLLSVCQAICQFGIFLRNTSSFFRLLAR